MWPFWVTVQRVYDNKKGGNQRLQMALQHKKEMCTDPRISKVEWGCPSGKGHHKMCTHPGGWVSMGQNIVEEIDIGVQGFLVSEGLGEGEGWALRSFSV